MSDIFIYYIASIVGSLKYIIAGMFIVSSLIGFYLWCYGANLIKELKNNTDNTKAIVELHAGEQWQKRSYILFACAPLLFLVAYCLPDKDVMMSQMGIVTVSPCMNANESGILIVGAGSVTGDQYTMYATYAMADGTNRMCSIPEMNAAGAILKLKYTVTRGKRLDQ